MVGLDFTPMDKTLVQTASFLAALLKPEKIYFVNAQEGLENAEEWFAEYPELDAPIDEKFKEEIEAELKLHYEPVDGVSTEILVLEGSVVKELNQQVQINQIDLLVVGRKNGLKGSGIISQKLAHKVPASILFVPEVGKPLLENILVAVDFSHNSRLAVEEAIELALLYNNCGITVLNTFWLPLKYYKIGKTEAESNQIARTNAERKCTQFLNEIDTKGIDLKPYFVSKREQYTYEAIYDFALVQQASIIVIGGMGHTNFSALLLGSIAKKLISVDMDIPLLVVKDKNATHGLLDILKQL
jgi:nucleotide-binding universal stress UspA family protein